MVVTMLCLLGIAAYSTMPRQEDPSFPYRAGLVSVVYPGASAADIERLVLQPLTDELRQVEELDYSQGIARTGVALLSLRLKDTIYETDPAWDRVRRAMDRARRDFPDDVGLMALDDRLIDIPAIVLAVAGSPSVTELTAVAERLKQNLGDISGLSRVELDGDSDEQITLALEDDPIPLVLRSREGTAISLERLLSVNIYNRQGDAIPLAALASVDTRWEAAVMYSRNGVPINTVAANLVTGFSFSQALDGMNRALESDPLPPGTRLELGGDAKGSGDANSALLKAAPIGILLLLFFLLLQFNSFRRVGIILLTVPLATVGIFPGLVLSGSPFGFQSLLGVIALVGIVVNNAIVLLDVMDRELDNGHDIFNAVRKAVEQRTRPILLTTATTVAGLLPLAFSSSTLWPPMAWAIISGLLASTVLTLLMIPAVCSLLIKVPVAEPDNSPA
nr:efflux RND transporter permease subunit [Marinobacter gelidimuriae]